MTGPSPAIGETVDRLLSPGRGVIALDEHHDLLARALGLDLADPIAKSRFRAIVLETPRLGQWISGVLVDAEALDTGLPELAPDDPLVGLRLGSDTGHYRFGDTIHRRRDEMRSHLTQCHDRGVRFVKWRADIDLLGGPASAYVDTGYLAACAQLSLEVGLLPVLDVTMPNQRTHSLAVAIAVTANALVSLRDELAAHGVSHGDVLIRMNMVRAGAWHADQTVPTQVGRSTLRTLATGLPDEAPGVLFMSTGMTLRPACDDLAAIVGEAERTGWDRPITFGFGRALVDRVIRTWARDGEVAAQAALAEDCQAAVAAIEGRLVEA